MRLTRVVPLSLNTLPELGGKPLFPTLQEAAAAQAGNTDAAQTFIPPDVNRAWSSVQWVMGHGLPIHLTDARTSARTISRLR